MRKWVQRVVGALAGGGGLWAFAERIVGLPGYVSDISTWRSWAAVDVVLLASAGVCIGGFALATSEWWWPRLRGKLRPVAIPTDDTGVVATSVADEATQHHIEAFTALLPIIERHLGACQPMTFKNIGIMPVMRAFPEFAADRQQLIATLDALDISTPEDDASIVDWHYYLTGLRLRVLTGNIEEARSFYLPQGGFP